MPILSLDDFKSLPIGQFAPGSWTVEYHDRTHLADKTYVPLGEVKIEEVSRKGDVLFSFRPTPRKPKNKQTTEHTPQEENYLESLLEKAWDQGAIEGKVNPADAADYISDQLEESMARLGLVQLTFEIDDPEFSERSFAVIILDTNALRGGAVRHLREQYGSVQLWTIIPLVSLMEIGERTANITQKAADKPKKQNCSLIRVRPQVTITPQEIRWLKKNFPTETLELVPELFRTFRGYEASREREPDRVLINDRLILEGIKDLRRQRGLPEVVYLMSGDKDMSRLARLEGIHTIYPARPGIRESPEGICSVRYSLEARTYILCSIHRFLWDLTHVFSRIRLQCLEGPQAGRIVELFYYFPTKLVHDWIADKLEVTGLGPGLTTNVI